mgnify:CR=1 FL=1
MWVFGVKTRAEAMKELEKFRLDGIVQKMKCPFLLLHGAGDEQIPLAIAEKCFAAVGSKDKTLKVFSREEGGFPRPLRWRPAPSSLTGSLHRLRRSRSSRWWPSGRLREGGRRQFSTSGRVAPPSFRIDWRRKVMFFWPSSRALLASIRRGKRTLSSYGRRRLKLWHPLPLPSRLSLDAHASRRSCRQRWCTSGPAWPRWCHHDWPRRVMWSWRAGRLRQRPGARFVSSAIPPLWLSRWEPATPDSTSSGWRDGVRGKPVCSRRCTFTRRRPWRGLGTFRDSSPRWMKAICGQ